jgi:hypothetical protein
MMTFSEVSQTPNGSNGSNYFFKVAIATPSEDKKTNWKKRCQVQRGSNWRRLVMKISIRGSIKNKFKSSHGYSYVQTILIIFFLLIFISVGLPRFTGFADLLKESVCHNNCSHLERMYQAYLDSEEIESTEVVFLKFKDEYYSKICPEGGVISYEDGKVLCGVHGEKGKIVDR